jgi:lysine 2,3-aminomutase
MPVTLPYRISDSLIRALTKVNRLNVVIVTHFNHPRELTPEAQRVLKALKYAGITVMNQNVLLRNINDQASVLAELYQSLYENGVIPYYLHHCDWTPGTFHFRTSVQIGRKIMDELRGLIAGPALPDYILDIPGGLGKISLLDRRVELEEVGSSEMGTLHSTAIDGEVWKVTPPQTRAEKIQAARFLNLFFR